MNIEQLIADLRARINPQYCDQVGTESYERHQVVKALESLMARIEVLRIENKALRADADRIDWLADVNNTVGSVVLPRALHPAHVVGAWEWIDTYCPHYATQGRDWQTTDNMSAASRVMAKRHLATLREAGLIEIESAPPRGNFVKKPL